MTKACAIALKLERGNTKGSVFNDVGRRILFAEAEEPSLAADQIRDYCRGHRLDIRSIVVTVPSDAKEREVRSAAKAVRKMIARIVGERITRELPL